jgi:hypothetical protein
MEGGREVRRERDLSDGGQASLALVSSLTIEERRAVDALKQDLATK